MPAEIIRLAILDDQVLFRKILSDYLTTQPDIRVILQTPDLPDLFPKLETGAIDVLLLHVSPVAGTAMLSLLRKRFPEVKVLVCTTGHPVWARYTEAAGYISGEDEPEELLRAIRTVTDNRPYHHHRHRTSKVQEEAIVTLSDRDKQLLQLLWEEKSNKEIADQLFLSVRSVEKIRQDLKEKLGVKSTVGLLKYAISCQVL